MAVRIKSKWHESGRNESRAKTLDDHAGALAFIAWRLSLDGARNLHGEGFDYDSDRQRVGVIAEFVAFQLQLADRLASLELDSDARNHFIQALAVRMSDYMQENLTEIAGAGDYRKPFVALLNERMTAYAEFSFRQDEAQFPACRYFAKQVLDIMGESQTNRWVMDQIQLIDAPRLFEVFGKSVRELFDSGANNA